MFSRAFVRSIAAAALAATLLVPTAQADTWGQEKAARVDPAIAAAINDRANLAAQPAAGRPDDLANARGVGSLPQPASASARGTFDWTNVGVGAGALFTALLLALGSLTAVRHGRGRVKSA
jgi:hypothetical protein